MADHIKGEYLEESALKQAVDIVALISYLLHEVGQRHSLAGAKSSNSKRASVT
jgi:hypothetical protein